MIKNYKNFILESNGNIEIIYIKDLRERHIIEKGINQYSGYNYIKYDIESMKEELDEKLYNGVNLRIEKLENDSWIKIPDMSGSFMIDKDFYRFRKLEIHENRLMLNCRLPVRGSGYSSMVKDLANSYELPGVKHRNEEKADLLRIVIDTGNKPTNLIVDPYNEEDWSDEDQYYNSFMD